MDRPSVVLVLAFVAGTPIALVVTWLYRTLEFHVFSGRQGELFAWAQATILIGDAVGSAVLGSVLGGPWGSGAGMLLTTGLLVLSSAALVAIPTVRRGS